MIMRQEKLDKFRNFKPARNLDDAWIAVDAFPLKPGDPRYLDCSEVRGDTLKRIKRMLQRHWRSELDLHLLFTGYRGNGKTTELYQFQSEVRENYEVIYFDAAKELDVNNLTLSDLLLAIAKETIEGMKDAGYRLPDNLLEDVGDWFFEKVLEKSESIDIEAGAKTKIGIPNWVSFITAKVFSGVKMNTKDREIMRRKLERDITQLIEKVNTILIEARRKVKDNKKDLIFIMDSLDRLRTGLDKNLFLRDGGLLKELRGNFIYVVPISLLYEEQATLLPFDEQLTLPMIPIYKRGIERHVDDVSVQLLTNLISKRLVLKEIFDYPEEAVKEFIFASGGHLRDLMKLISYACNLTDDKITQKHVKAAINTLVRDYEKVVRDDEYEHLIKTYYTQNPPNNQMNQKLIYNNVVLVYQDPYEIEWKDVHPAVVKNNKFQKTMAKVKE